VVFSSEPLLHSGTLKLGTPLHPPELTAETTEYRRLQQEFAKSAY
jgi:hypothetical protein